MDLRPSRGLLLMVGVLASAGCRDGTAAAPQPALPVSEVLLFTTTRNGRPDIYEMEVTGDNPRAITTDPQIDQGADLMHHDQLVVWMSTRAGAGHQVFSISMGRRGLAQLTTGPGENGFPRWSPDDHAIVFTSLRNGNAELYRMDADGTGQVRLTSDPGEDTGAGWSPDGRHIAFLSSRDGTMQLYVMGADGRDVVRLTSDAFPKGGHAAWSPDGTRIAYHAFNGATADIFVVNADGTHLTRLTSHLANDRYPTWSPDGTRLAFATDRDGDDEVYVMNADGSGLQRLTRSAGSDVPDSWR